MSVWFDPTNPFHRDPKPHTRLASIEDYDWFMQTVKKMEWKYASTYADSIPHWYCTREKTKAITLDEYHRALTCIRTFGVIERFGRFNNMYFHDDEGFKYWSTGVRLDDWMQVGLINRAQGDVYYKEQVAHFPSYVPGTFAEYDAFALTYADSRIPQQRNLWEAVHGGDDTIFSVLDLGAGMGATLEQKVVANHELYTAVDPSRAMLGQLSTNPLNKWVRDFQIMTAAKFLAQSTRKYDAVAASEGSANYLSEQEIVGAWEAASKRMILSIDPSKPSMSSVIRTLKQLNARTKTIIGERSPYLTVRLEK